MYSFNEEKRELIHKWREERKRKLMARLYRNNPRGPTMSSPILSAILGIKPSGNASANASEQKSYRQSAKIDNVKKSFAPLALLKDRKGGRVEKRHTLNPDGESLSPIEGSNHDSAMTGGTRRLSSTPLRSSTPERKYMSEKLSSWLKTKGKPMESFHHLKCFLPHKEGSRLPIRQPFKEPNTNSNSAPLKTSAPKSRPTNLPAIVIETIPQEKENSKGDLTINLESTEPPCSLTREQEDLASCGDCKPLDETTIVLDSENLKETTVKALHELLTLIHTGYPWESCKEWLTALRSRNPDAESLPDFWECLAALEEKQGDMQMAVDSYQRALMRGAQVSHIDVCLDSLFEKMNALNLECQPYTPRQTDGKVKNRVDDKNIFKSTVIQFALMQQKVKTFSSESGVNLKNLDYIATPVRRSTRQSLFTSKTPQRCTSSLKNLMSEDQENVQFKPNKALLFDD